MEFSMREPLMDCTLRNSFCSNVDLQAWNRSLIFSTAS